MKKSILASLFAAFALPMSAAVLYVDLEDLVIPNTSEGVYINVLTGANQDFYPASFNTEPWINLYLGGLGISNSDLLRPWASQSPGSYDPSLAGHYFINVAPGTTIDGSGVFVNGETNSEFHLGVDGNQFQAGVQGYLAFAYEASVGGGTSYGWLSVTLSSGGAGVSIDLARDDAPGEALEVAAVPEPSTLALCAGLSALGAGMIRRRRAAL